MKRIKKILFAAAVLCLIAGFIIGWGAALREQARSNESRHVTVLIIETGTTPGSVLSHGLPWTLCELPGGRRIHLRGIWGKPGERAMVLVRRYQAPELFDGH